MRKRLKYMNKWEYIITVPGVELSDSIDSEYMSFVGPTDERYQEIYHSHPNMSKYLDSFRDVFGKKLSPSIIIRKERDALIEHWDLACFRNIIAIPSVMKSRLMNYLNPFPNNVPFTDMFEFCLVNIGKDFENLVFRTPSESGAGNDVDKFSYNPNPAVIHPQLFKVEYDEPLMNALIKLYDDQSNNPQVRELKKKVYRSLEMVFYALRTFTTNLGTAYDYGFVVSLWVPSFEILANPLKGRVTYREVENLINRIPWHSSELRKYNYKRVNYYYGKGGRKYDKVSLPNQIYSRLHYMRNLILHGSPINTMQMEPKSRNKWTPLIVQTPALYRCLLLNMLSDNGYGQYPIIDETFEGIWKNRNYIRYFEEILFKPFNKRKDE